jgi:hypothetical protein
MRAKKGADADVMALPDKVVNLSRSTRLTQRAAAPKASTVLTREEMYALFTKEEQQIEMNLMRDLWARHP